MSHEVESMMFVREKPWHYELTKDVSKLIEEAPDSKSAIELAGLNWKVEKKEILLSDYGNVIEGYNDIFPINDDMSDREKNGVNKLKEEYMVCYYMPDIEKFRGTGWGVVNAMTDMVAHSKPQRVTKNYSENNWARIMNGHILVDRIATAVNAL